MEMHEYEMLIELARELGQNDVAEVAELNLAEEVNAESTLKELEENGGMKEQKG
jgi:ferritin-like metal-binding protein YciE